MVAALSGLRSAPPVISDKLSGTVGMCIGVSPMFWSSDSRISDIPSIGVNEYMSVSAQYVSGAQNANWRQEGSRRRDG